MSHINLPNGEQLIPDADFRQQVGGVSDRTGRNWDQQGCPYTYIGNRKYRPLNEGLTWVASRIQRRNPPRRARGGSRPLSAA